MFIIVNKLIKKREFNIHKEIFSPLPPTEQSCLIPDKRCYEAGPTPTHGSQTHTNIIWLFSTDTEIKGENEKLVMF